MPTQTGVPVPTNEELRQRWDDYETSIKMMGDTRNSYSKTNQNATFMRMKDDRMR